ncbi:golgin subfamily A member 7 isoform X1 [Homalodisca vitripennis]|uniref:golgin subfamily A member 7 isoform X1 n=1 Tax=Homalodisca vitripennis TaxID=197043 RepID=UPI001EEA53F0|nr:golgin subfamily A member 7 isoform X1 [Homalodisca vitripennis]
MKPKAMPNHTTPLDDVAPRQGQTQLCMKVFVQRDYSDGTTVRFQTHFPSELEGKLDRASFENTVSQLNTYFAEAEKGSCSTYCEGCLACLTAYLVSIITITLCSTAGQSFIREHSVTAEHILRRGREGLL